MAILVRRASHLGREPHFSLLMGPYLIELTSPKPTDHDLFDKSPNQELEWSLRSVSHYGTWLCSCIVWAKIYGWSESRHLEAVSCFRDE